MDATRARTEIARVIDQYQADVAGIRANDRLSDLARRDDVRTAYEATVSAVDKLRAASDEATAARRAALMRSLFGLPATATSTDVVSYRDAQDRVAKVTDFTELCALLDRAQTIGDTALVKAGVSVAFDRSRSNIKGGSWGAIVDEYAAMNPSKADDVNELRAVTAGLSATDALGRAMVTSVPRPPEMDDRRALSDKGPTDNRPKPGAFGMQPGVGAPPVPVRTQDWLYR